MDGLGKSLYRCLIRENTLWLDSQSICENTGWVDRPDLRECGREGAKKRIYLLVSLIRLASCLYFGWGDRFYRVAWVCIWWHCFDSAMMIGDDKNHWSYGSSLHFLFTRVDGDTQYQENVFNVPLVSYPGHIHVSMDGRRQQTGRSFWKVSTFGFLGKKK